MPGIFVDSLLVLRYPVCVRAPDLGKTFHTYLASSKVNGHSFAFSITVPASEGASLLPHGTVAQVAGPLGLAGKALLVPATSVVGLYLATSRASRRNLERLFEPYLSFSGIVTRVLPVDVARPGVKEVEVTVDCSAAWPRRRITLRCYWNRDERRFYSLAAMRVGMSLHISGVLMGWADGLLGVDVHQVRPNNGGDLTVPSYVATQTLFERVGIMNDFAMFADPCSLPPRAGLPGSLAHADTASARWLDTVAGLPRRDEAYPGLPAKRPAPSAVDGDSTEDTVRTLNVPGGSGHSAVSARVIASQARATRALVAREARRAKMPAVSA